MEVSSELLEVIGLYGTFDTLVNLVTITRSGTRVAYYRNNILWRNKAQVETVGLTHDGTVVPDWLLYYQMVNKHHFGDLVVPYPTAGKSYITGEGVTHFADLERDFVDIRTDGYIRYSYEHKSRSSGKTKIRTSKHRLPNSVRSIIDREGNAAYIILENGDVLEIGYRKGISLDKLPLGNDFIVDLQLVDNEFFLILTRDGEVKK